MSAYEWTPDSQWFIEDPDWSLRHAVEEEITLTVGPDWRDLGDQRVALLTGYPVRVIEIMRETPPPHAA